MFDNLRDEAASSSLFEEEAKYQPAAGTSSAPRRSKRILGMSGVQRFVLAVMFMLVVVVIGVMALLITNKIGF